jgi:hypothetical protein
MRINEYCDMWRPIVTLALVLAGAVAPDRLQAQTAVPMTFNADVQVTNLHPNVSGVGMTCMAPLPVSLVIGAGMTMSSTPVARSAQKPLVNRAFSGPITATVNIPATVLAIPANRTLTFTCQLDLYQGNGYRSAAASAAVPQSITAQNFEVVAVGSAVTWSQTVTFQ